MVPLHGLSRQQIFELTRTYTPDEARRVLYDWRVWGRQAQQLPDGQDWRTWIIMAGRGFGKTRTGSEGVRVWAQKPCRIALIAPTSKDARDVMVEGESGILNAFPPWERPFYQPSRARIRFRSGAVGFLYSAEEPERLRGPQHHYAWLDEFCVYPKLKQLWENLQFGLRLGAQPRVLATSTPRPLRFLTELLADPSTVVSRGSTFDNARNLPQSVLHEFQRVYGGTRTGRQELQGEILEEAEGALWMRANLEACRVRVAPELARIVVAIDPAVTAGENSDECGIVACGLGVDGHGYVLADRTCRLPPAQWASRAISLFDALQANHVIAETNNGGDLVETVLRTERKSLPYKKVTASRGKVTRAEPIAALYEQGRVHHVGGMPELEDEMCGFVPGALTKSPNRADALVWGLSFLMLKPEKVGRIEWLS